MAHEARKLELFRFADPGQSVALEVDCGEPLVTREEWYYAASLVVESDFVRGRVGLVASAGAWTLGSVASMPFMLRNVSSGLLLTGVPG